jgi:hypothetical protein
VGLSALAALLDFLNLKTQAESLLFGVLLFLLFYIKTMGVSSQCLDDGLLVFSYVFTVIATIMTITVLIAKYFFLKAFAIELEAL